MPGYEKVTSVLSNINQYLAGELSLIPLICAILLLIGMWRIFEKAREPGWKALIPVYNYYTLIKITGRPAWWFWFITFGLAGSYILLLLSVFFIPAGPIIATVILIGVAIVSGLMQVLVYYSLSKSFGKGLGTTIGLFFLPFIFVLILGFGKAKYKKLKYK